jgi:serine/alanine adding enzyme
MLQLRPATDNERAHWDELLVSHNGADRAIFTQSYAYAEVKRATQWTPLFMVYEGKSYTRFVLILQRSVPGAGLLWYIPTAAFDLSQMADFTKANEEYIKEHAPKVFLVKIEPYILMSGAVRKQLKKIGLLKAGAIQLDVTTIIMPLFDSPEVLLESLRTRGRRDVRRSDRQELDIRQMKPSQKVFREMYELMKTVNSGEGTASIRPLEYYATFWKQFCDRRQGALYFAYEGKRPVASAFIIMYGDKAVYKDGGSSPKRIISNEYATAIQWRAMRDAQAAGMKRYDLCVVPPAESLNDTKHPWYQIGHFKAKFNDEVIEYVGCYDQVIRPGRYKFWKKVGWRLANKLHRARYHDQYY